MGGTLGHLRFHTAAITQKGVDQRPVDHLPLVKWPRVKMSLASIEEVSAARHGRGEIPATYLRTGIKAYAAIVGTPEMEIREVKATLEGRMVQSRTAAT